MTTEIPHDAHSCPLCGGDHAALTYESGPRSSVDWGVPRVRFNICSTCGFMYADPGPDEEAMTAYYALDPSASGTVLRRDEKGPHENTTDRRMASIDRYWQTYRGDRPGKHLDVGCGAGHLLSQTSQRGWETCGLEPSEAATATAREMGLDVVPGTMEHASFPAGSFDLVTCLCALEHAWSVPRAIGNMVSWLTPDGLLIVEVPDTTQPWPQLTECYSFEHLSHFTETTLTAALVEAGLRVLEINRTERPKSSRRKSIHLQAVAQIGVGNPPPPHDLAQARDGLIEAVTEYRRERERLVDSIGARLGARLTEWRSQGLNVAVYGGGWHTRYLFDTVPIADLVDVIVDSDPRRWGAEFLGRRVVEPGELARGGYDAVIVSSAAYEEEITSTVRSLAGDDLEIVTLYGDE